MSAITLYLGRRGSGKTLTMVKDAFIEYKRGKRIITNMDGLSFGEYMENEDIKNLSKESEISNAVLLIDEAQIFFDSRRAMSKGNLKFSNFIQQLRKRNIDMLITTQFSNAIDKRIRDHVDFICFPNFLKEYDVVECEYQDATSIEDPYAFDVKRAHTWYNAIPVYNLYDSNEMVV